MFEFLKIERFANLRLASLDDTGTPVPGQPVVRRLTSKTLKTMEDYLASWTMYDEHGDEEYEEEVLVEKGFECDQASIPRLLTWLVPKGGLHDGPSVIHDWCYRNQWGGSRKRCDDLFLAGMKAAGTWWLRRYAMYFAVRAFGWMPYRNS